MKKVSLVQTRSSIGRNERVKGTLRALGLGRIGKKKELEMTKAVQGMVTSVKYLVEVREV